MPATGSVAALITKATGVEPNRRAIGGGPPG